MARFLFTVWSFPGDLGPSVAVALALRARGHEVAFYTGKRAAATMQLLDLRHFPMLVADEEVLYGSLRHAQGTGLASSLRELIRLRPTLRRWLVDPIAGQVADLERILDAWHPDAIVCDPMVWAPYLILHETRGIAVAILSWSAAAMLSGTEGMLWGLGLRPPATTAQRRYNAAMRTFVTMANRDFRQSINALRARHGLGPIRMPIMDYAGTMPLYMIASSRDFDYNRAGLPESAHYVGHCAWALPSPGPPDWLAALSAHRPLVVVTEGTIESGAPRLLAAAARGLANQPVQVLIKDAQILEPGRAPGTVGLGVLAPNIRCEGFVLGQGWQPEVLARTRAFVTNGGAGSILAGLAAGVPLVVVPTTWDKPENARRAVAAGAGVAIPPRRCTPRRLREAVQHVLTTPSYRDNARRIGRTLTAMPGPERAAALLEDLVGRTVQPVL
jgi:MGT family glycosyltransferase